MIFIVKNGREVNFRKLEKTDFEQLVQYLQNLSEESKSRFGPHQFDFESIKQFYEDKNNHFGIIGIEHLGNQIVAYSILKQGYILADSKRYESYQMPLSKKSDTTYAPSVADDWQSQGIGDAMFKYVLSNLQSTEQKRIILWGGVQKSNEKAVNYYKKNGFITYGQFKNELDNWDMAYQIKF